MSLLLDLSDERRFAKTWLPSDDRDVTNGLVVKSSLLWDGRPDCIRHGAMHLISPPGDDQSRIYRCSECGVGAIWYPTGSPASKRAFSRAWDSKYLLGRERANE